MLDRDKIFKALDAREITAEQACTCSDFSMEICFTDSELHAAIEKVPEQLIWDIQFMEVEHGGQRRSCWLLFHSRVDAGPQDKSG